MKTNRRNFIKGAGAAGGLALYGAASTQYPRLSPIGRADAIPPVIIAGAAVAGGSMATGWILREFEVIGADSPPEGLTAGSLKDQVYNILLTRKSTNASTFVDNRNIISSGLSHTLYSEGKIAAIDAINAEETKSAVTTAATNAVDSHVATIQKNLLRSWNESVAELETVANALSSHPDATVGEMMTVYATSGSFTDVAPDISSRSVTLADGSDFSLSRIGFDGFNYVYDPLKKEVSGEDCYVKFDSDYSKKYLAWTDWNGIWSDIGSVTTTVSDGLVMWVENVYSQIQAGELDTADLLTPSELAAMTADQENFNQAVADLMALNIPTNLEREAEVHVPSKGITVYGSLAVTGETTLSVGTVDPTADSYSYYLTYDVSQGSGSWSSYNTGVDGGQVTLTEEPYDGVEYHITTGANETAVVDGGNFTAQNDTWVADVSDQLNTSITNVTSVDFYAPSEQVQYETVQLTESFEIISFTDSDGIQHDSAAYSRSAPQDDTNYISQSEWDALKSRQEELIDKYEKASSGGGGGGFSLGGGDTPLLLVAAGAIVALVMGGRR